MRCSPSSSTTQCITTGIISLSMLYCHCHTSHQTIDWTSRARHSKPHPAPYYSELQPYKFNSMTAEPLIHFTSCISLSLRLLLSPKSGLRPKKLKSFFHLYSAIRWDQSSDWAIAQSKVIRWDQTSDWAIAQSKVHVNSAVGSASQDTGQCTTSLSHWCKSKQRNSELSQRAMNSYYYY